MKDSSRTIILSMIIAAVPMVLTAQHVDNLSEPGLEAMAHRLEVGASLRIDNVPLAEDLGAVTLELERFEVFASDARITVTGEAGETILPAPKNAYFRGHIAGDGFSVAVLTARAAGGMRGIIASNGRYWVMATDPGDGSRGPMQIREINADVEYADKVASFSCGADQLGDSKAMIDRAFAHASEASFAESFKEDRGPVSYTAKIGVETDFEFYNLFGNTTDATDYIGDLIAFSSTVYSAEVDTSMLLSDIFLYTTASDPWVQFSTTCGLMEFGKYWNDNRSGVERSIAHFMSGKNNGGGVAWVGVMCSAAFDVTLSDFGLSCAGLANNSNYGGDYGYSGTMDGDFNIATAGVVWDIVVTMHEMGHNFNSPHSHCYAGLGGNASPVDTCNAGQCGQSGCYCGGTGLPCASPGTGCGTIMSYCHLLGPGISNISLTLGQGHPWGTDPGRIPSRMNDHVVAQAMAVPGCLDFDAGPQSIFADGFASGDTTAWALAVP